MNISRIRVTLFEVDNSNADLAELYSTADPTIQLGEVVALDPAITNGVKRTTAPYEKGTIGIISTAPALLIGGKDDGVTAVPVALSGRVPVKVTGQNGPIKPGDLLTSSSIPGVAMKATKAGQIIGQAMTGFDGEGQGSVMVFVKSGFANGVGLDELMPDLANTDPSQTGKLALGQLLTAQVTAAPAGLSEISTDRLVAGLEIITPSITADKVALSTIEAATSQGIQINSDVMLNGTLTVHKIKADEIEGLAIFTDQIKSLSAKLNTQAQVLSDTTDQPSPAADSTDMINLLAQNATVSLTLNVSGMLHANGGLQVGGQADFYGNTFFHRLARFVDKAVFDRDVVFNGPVTFNSDTGGFATIHAAQQEVKVRFDQAYPEEPVVTVNVRNGQFVRYAYKDLTPEGFTIVLENPAASDVEFTWTALHVAEPTTQDIPVVTP